MLSSEEDSDAARGALRSIDGAGPEAVPTLLEGLESEDRRRRYYAMYLLGKVGPAAKAALPILKRMRDETESRRYRESYQRTIDQIEAGSE
jgi:HEAT repeat protein